MGLTPIGALSLYLLRGVGMCGMVCGWGCSGRSRVLRWCGGGVGDYGACVVGSSSLGGGILGMLGCFAWVGYWALAYLLIYKPIFVSLQFV